MSSVKLHAGIFAAGEGSRLQAAFPGLIKPMVPVGGRPMVHWAVRQLEEAGCGDITILFNSKGRPAAEYLKTAFPALRFEFIIQDSPTSYESFRIVSRALSAKAGDFLLTTVDAFYEPEKLASFFSSARASGAPAAFGVIDKINDEKPLWVDLDGRGFITAMGPDASDHVWATNGVYYVTDRLSLPEPGRFKALREYLTKSVREGAGFFSFPISAGADVDDSDDIRLAEEFLASRGLCGTGA